MTSKEKKVTEIHLFWDGPFSIDEIESNDFSDSEGTPVKSFGIYCVYGKTALSASESLIYIGKTIRQSFQARIDQNRWSDNPAGRSVNIRLGRLLARDGESLTAERAEELINAAEELLIHALSPARNARSIKSLPWCQYGTTHVLNWGAYGDLLPEISGRYYCTDHDDVNDYADWPDP